MLLHLPYRLCILPVLFLFSFAGLVRAQDSLRFIRHTLHLNLMPGIEREVQLSYERALGPNSSLEMVLSGRIPVPGQLDTRSLGMVFGPPSYDEQVYTLSYENAFGAGVHWKGSLKPGKRKGFIPFISPGILYRYQFFDDKHYKEVNAKDQESFAQQFSLRKHEINARVLLGIRRHFYLRGGKSAFSTEASLGFGGGQRFGKMLNVRRYYGPTYGYPSGTWTGRPVEPYSSRFNEGVFTLPLNLKIGYSWGG
jgi:hypothetical protein